MECFLVECMRLLLTRNGHWCRVAYPGCEPVSLVGSEFPKGNSHTGRNDVDALSGTLVMPLTVVSPSVGR
jgi:hypothetical protein